MITTDMRKPIPKTLSEVFEANYNIVIWDDEYYSFGDDVSFLFFRLISKNEA
jgi:hypothetical protein